MNNEVTETANCGALDTIGGNFCYVWHTEVTGRPAVLASGWGEPEDLRQLIHANLRPAKLRTANSPQIDQAVAAWAAGEIDALEGIAVRQRSGPFLEQAWRVLRGIRGTVTYAEFAALAGNPAATRAAASACARNAAALFVPCHRVLRTDGTLGGFRYGLAVKRRLIEHESAA